jgi:hypothetical protein
VAEDVEELVDHIQTLGMERALKSYYSIYRAFCIDNKDPEKRGRIKIACPEVGHNPTTGLQDTWVDPVFDAVGPNMGSFWPPIVGSVVRVFFLNGHPSEPIGYLGGWFTRSDGTNKCPTEFAHGPDGSPETRGFVTRAGHMFLFKDTPGEEAVNLIWHRPDSGDQSLSDATKTADRGQGDFAFLNFNKDGSVQLGNAKGAMLTLDAAEGQNLLVDEHGNSVTTDADGIKLIDKAGNLISIDAKAGDITMVAENNLNFTAKTMNIKTGGVYLCDSATLSAVLGEPLMAWLASHTHTCAAPNSPSSPPVVPPPPSILSKNVKLK